MIHEDGGARGKAAASTGGQERRSKRAMKVQGRRWDWLVGLVEKMVEVEKVEEVGSLKKWCSIERWV